MTFIADNIVSKNNVLGADKKAKAGWAQDLGLPNRSDTVFYAGCGYQYESGLESLMSLLRRLDRSSLGAERPLGHGSVGMERFLAKLRSVGYRGTLHIEREGAADPQLRLRDIRAAVELLEQLRG